MDTICNWYKIWLKCNDFCFQNCLKRYKEFANNLNYNYPQRSCCLLIKTKHVYVWPAGIYIEHIYCYNKILIMFSLKRKCVSLNGSAFPPPCSIFYHNVATYVVQTVRVFRQSGQTHFGDKWNLERHKFMGIALTVLFNALWGVLPRTQPRGSRNRTEKWKRCRRSSGLFLMVSLCVIL